MSKKPRAFTIRQAKILTFLRDYSYNSMEICRALNGIPPREFLGCYESQDFGLCRKGERCLMKKRCCKHRSDSVYLSLKAMRKRGLIKSLKLTWFDGRDPGAVDHIPTDKFRFYFTSKKNLAKRLIEDIEKKLLEND